MSARAARGPEESTSPQLPPRREGGQRLLVGGRIEAVDAVPGTDLLADEILERCLFEGFLGDLVDQARRDDDDAVGIAQDVVAGKDGGIAAADRHADLAGLGQAAIGRPPHALLLAPEA